MNNYNVAGHSFEGESIDARCTRTHTDSSERCTMTRSWLWTAPDDAVNKTGWAGYGCLSSNELNEIRQDEQRIRGRAWDAIVGVCTS